MLDDHKAAAKQHAEHRRDAMRQEEASAQAGYFPASWSRT